MSLKCSKIETDQWGFTVFMGKRLERIVFFIVLCALETMIEVL